MTADPKSALPRGADLGPADRHRKGAPVTLERTGRGGGVRARVQAQTALDRYFLRRQLDPADPAANCRLFDAGQRLLRDWTLAGLESSVTGGYRELVDGGKRIDRAVLREDAYRRFRAAIQAVGPIAAGEVIEVACAGNSVGRVGIEILRRGLAVLADHYQREGACKRGGQGPDNSR